MPRIEEYTAQHDKLQPTETGVDAMAQAARRLGAFYNQAGETERRAAQDVARGAEGIVAGTKAFVGSANQGFKGVEQAAEAAEVYGANQEIRTGVKDASGALNSLSNAWNSSFSDAVNRDPNDKTIQAKFLEQNFEPWASSFVQGFNTPGGKDWANKEVDKLRDHFTTTTNADMVRLEGIAAKSDFEKSATSWTNTARTDPGSVPTLLDMADRSINTILSTHPHMNPTEAATLKEEMLDRTQKQIVRAGALGAISNSADPTHAWQTWAKQYPNLIDATEMAQFAKAAQGYEHMNQAEERAQRQETDRVASRKLSSDIINLETSTIGSDGKSNVTPDTIKQFRKIIDGNPNGAALMHGEVMSTFKGLQAQLAREGKPEPTAEVSNRNQIELFNQIRAPDADLLKAKDAVNDAYGRGELKWSGRQELLKEIEAVKTPEGKQEAAFKRELTKAVAPKLDPLKNSTGADRLYRWQYELQSRMGRLQRAGKDPAAVFDPHSPEYMGSAEALQPYTQPLAARVQAAGGVGAPLPSTFKDRFQAAGPEAPPAKFYNGKFYMRGPHGESVEVQ